MKIAFCTRNDFLTVRGGDTVQLLATRDLLQARHGLSVDIVADPGRLDASRYDLCHIFNIQRIAETRAYMDRCRSAGTKVALSTVLWDFSAVVTYNFMVKRLAITTLTPARLEVARWALRLIAVAAGMPTIFTAAYRDYLRQALGGADLLLPNSGEETEQLVRLSGLDRNKLLAKTVAIVNAVPPETPLADIDTPQLPAGFVLQVGRIEPGKNQLSTIKALMDRADIALVFVGNQRVNPAYYRAAEAAGRARGNVTFIDELPQEQLTALYRRAALHVLPSLGETTGLVSLEALANGCRAVVADSRYCPFESYFAGMATAVDPLDIHSIRDGILSELSSQRDMAEIGRRVRQRYSWDVAARQTFEAYRRLFDDTACKGNGNA